MSTPNPTHIDIIAKHADFVGGDSIRHCSCGRWHSSDGQGQHSRLAHAAHVVSKLTDAGYSIVKRDALARAMYLDQARHHVHPDDSMSPEQSWDEGFFPRKSLWLEKADYILAATAEGDKP